MGWRRRVEFWLCPDLSAAAVATGASSTRDIIVLASAMSEHIGRSEATISNKAVGHARLFERLRAGHGCTVKTAQSTIVWFDANWPAGLACRSGLAVWPGGLAWLASIPRPGRNKESM